MEQMQRARFVGRGVELPYPLHMHTLPNLHVFTNPEALQTMSFWIFIEALLPIDMVD